MSGDGGTGQIKCHAYAFLRVFLEYFLSQDTPIH